MKAVIAKCNIIFFYFTRFVSARSVMI